MMAVFVTASVTRWQDYLFNIWSFSTLKMLPYSTKLLPKYIQNFAKNKINPKNSEMLLIILPKWQNLVTLVTDYRRRLLS